MTDFNKGDKIRATLKETGFSQELWLTEFEEEPGNLYTYHEWDFTCPVVPLEEVLADEALDIELIVSAEDALPTVPGEYEDRIREEFKVNMRAVAPDFEFDEATLSPWVLNEDGSWTSPKGENRPVEDNWTLAVRGFEFFPWEDRAVR